MGRWAFEGVEYATRGEMCAARRRRYAELLEAGMNFTQAAIRPEFLRTFGFPP